MQAVTPTDSTFAAVENIYMESYASRQICEEDYKKNIKDYVVSASISVSAYYGMVLL